MPKNSLTKDEIKTRVLKLKNSVYGENINYDHKEVAHKYLNRVLEIIEEYRM